MRVRLSLGGLLLLALVFASPSGAETPAASDAAEEAEPGLAEQQTLGKLVLRVSPRSRISTAREIEDNIFRISLWRQEEAIGAQVAQAGVPAVETFSVVPLSRYAVRLDLRLDPRAKGVSVVRSSPDHLEIHFAEHRFASSSVRLATRRARRSEDRRAHTVRDVALERIILSPIRDTPPLVVWEPIVWPMGVESPVRVPLALDFEPHSIGPVPREVRQNWASRPSIQAAVDLADQGLLVEASETLANIEMHDDLQRALAGLARAYVWSQTDGRGEPLAAGRAADAFLLAAGLQPEASWASWARGSAGYYFQRERRFHDALVQYNKAITLSPGHSLRPIWEVGLGICLLETYRLEEGMEQLIDTLGSLGSDYGELTFAGRRAVAHALWVSGDFVHAASVVDLLLEDSPSFARSSKYDARWARMYLDAGRSSAAMPFLERLEKEGVSKAQRERARWWLHEVALAHRDSSQARRWLRKILDQTPGSVLVPLAESRLRVLESVEVGGVGRGMSWQSVTMDLRNRALDWPFTPVEDEALSLSAQLFIELGLIEEALSLYSWVEERTPSEGGAIAYEHVVCKLAPRTFSELRSRGEITRALGVYRSFLDEPRMYSCIDVSTRAEASSAALAAGLPDLATRWLGQAVAQDTVQTDAARNLVQLADIYLREGEVQSAEQTLVYLETVDLKIAAGVLDSAWGDVLAAQGEYAEAEARYSKALVLAADYVRTRGLIPSLYYRRGLVREELGEFDGALEDMAFGLENGGADDPAVGWYRFVAIASGMASSKEDFEEILVACDSAEAAASEDDDFRGLRWYRSLALRDLGRLREAATILDELSLGSDSWALRAAELRSSDDFALLRTGQQVDGAVSER